MLFRSSLERIGSNWEGRARCTFASRPAKLGAEVKNNKVNASNTLIYRIIIACTENHNYTESQQYHYQKEQPEISRMSFFMNHSACRSVLFIYFINFCTHSLKCFPLCSKLSYIPQLAHAGERSTTSPQTANSLAICTASPISETSVTSVKP